MPVLDVPTASDNGVSDLGGGFADLLLLGALACEAPIVMARFRDRAGDWSIVAHGFAEPITRGDHQLIEKIAGRPRPLDLRPSDTSVHSQVLQPPYSMRWAYGVSTRDAEGEPLETIAILDRWAREVTGKESRVLGVLARRANYLLHGPQATYQPSDHLNVSPSQYTERDRDRRAPDELRSAPLPQLLRVSDVARLFDVTERTILNWTAADRIPSIRTIGGHRRFRREDIVPLLGVEEVQAAD